MTKVFFLSPWTPCRGETSRLSESKGRQQQNQKIKFRVLEFNKIIFLMNCTSKLRQTCNYSARTAVFPHMKFYSKLTKTCSEKSALKKSLGYQKKKKINTHHFQLYALKKIIKNQASIHRLLFFNSSGLEAAVPIPNIIGKEEGRNISITQQRGLSRSGHFSFVAFSSQQLPTYSLSGDISGVRQSIFLCSLHC